MAGNPVKPERVLEEIDVNELSIVDKAANLKEFLIIKSKTGARTVIKQDQIKTDETDVTKAGADGSASVETKTADGALGAETPAGTESAAADATPATDEGPTAESIAKSIENAQFQIEEIGKAGKKLSAASVQKLEGALGTLSELHKEVTDPATAVTKELMSVVQGLAAEVKTLAKSIGGEAGDETPAADDSKGGDKVRAVAKGLDGDEGAAAGAADGDGGFDHRDVSKAAPDDFWGGTAVG